MKTVLDSPTLHCTSLFGANQMRQDGLQTVCKDLAKIFKSVFNIVKGRKLLIPSPPCLFLRSNFPIPLVKCLGMEPLPHPVVIDGSQQGDKHVQQPQVHFVGQTTNSRRLIQPDQLQRFPDLILFYVPLTPSHFSRRKAREVGNINVKLNRAQSGLPGKKLQEILPELFTDGFVL